MADEGQTGTALAATGSSANHNPLQRLGALSANAIGRYHSMSPGRRQSLLVSALLVAAVGAGMMWYAGKTDWRMLFSGLDAKDTQMLAQELTAANIPFQLTDDGGGIEVGADQIQRARMAVATKGMPQSGRLGFELFDKPNWVGSEFDEKVNYQRALEGELEHTIETIAAVRSARVHIVLPKDSMFDEAAHEAKASVVLQLRRTLLEPEQAQAIRSLLAGAVENLSVDNVTLVDADGRQSLATEGLAVAQGNAEKTLEKKLVSMLEPAAGGGNVRASVSISYDQGSEEKTDEVFDPTQTAPLSMQKSEQTTGPRTRPSGVPGTASNSASAEPPRSVQGSGGDGTPPTTNLNVPPLLQGAKSGTLPVYPQNGASGDGQILSEETASYGVTKHLSHSEQGPGRVRRLSAAIIVNDRMITEGVGRQAHTIWKPRTVEEMQRLEQLARAAVGIDTSRGDQVVVENVSFSSNVPEGVTTGMQKELEQASALLHAQPGLTRAFTVSILGLVLIFLVLRPVSRQMVSALSHTPPLALATGGQEQEPGAGNTATASSPIPKLFDSGRRLGQPSDAQMVFEHIATQIRKEPTQSTRLLESWISAPVGEGE